MDIPEPGHEADAEKGEKEDVDQNIVNIEERVSDDENIVKK